MKCFVRILADMVLFKKFHISLLLLHKLTDMPSSYFKVAMFSDSISKELGVQPKSAIRGNTA